MNDLTKIENEVYSFIKEYFETNKYSPSYREIQDKIGYSLYTIQTAIYNLKFKKYIGFTPYVSRSIVILK